MVMSDAERQRKRRAKLKNEAKKQIFVTGEGGEFDERIRIALAVRELSHAKQIPEEVIELIAKKAETVFPTKDLINRKYIHKLIINYLTPEEK